MQGPAAVEGSLQSPATATRPERRQSRTTRWGEAMTLGMETLPRDGNTALDGSLEPKPEADAVCMVHTHEVAATMFESSHVAAGPRVNPRLWSARARRWCRPNKSERLVNKAPSTTTQEMLTEKAPKAGVCNRSGTRRRAEHGRWRGGSVRSETAERRH